MKSMWAGIIIASAAFTIAVIGIYRDNKKSKSTTKSEKKKDGLDGQGLALVILSLLYHGINCV